jgi:hypothetical protein
MLVAERDGCSTEEEQPSDDDVRAEEHEDRDSVVQSDAPATTAFKTDAHGWLERITSVSGWQAATGGALHCRSEVADVVRKVWQEP